MTKRALITGINGQDGSYLAELLLEKGYEVHGTLRRASVFTTERIDHLLEHDNLHTYHGDLTDSSNLHSLVKQIEPNEVYNLGAQSHVAVSFDVPEYTAEVDALGTIRLLNAIKDAGQSPKFYQASTSELFGGLPDTVPQNESTPFYPKSPYGAAKLFAYWATVNYREAYNLFACNGILFNHESPRRGKTFITKKVSSAVARIKLGLQSELVVGNLDAMRDWGFAGDYVECMWMMLQREKPEDYVIATGVAHSVRDFIQWAFETVGIQIEWEGSGVEEVGKSADKGEILVRVSAKYFRPAEVEYLLGDATKAKNELGWKPKTSLRELIEMMVKADINEIQGVGKL